MGRSPSKLEDDDEGDEVDEGGPLWSVFTTAYTLIKDEGERDHNADRACKTKKKKRKISNI